MVKSEVRNLHLQLVVPFVQLPRFAQVAQAFTVVPLRLDALFVDLVFTADTDHCISRLRRSRDLHCLLFTPPRAPSDTHSSLSTNRSHGCASATQDADPDDCDRDTHS